MANAFSPWTAENSTPARTGLAEWLADRRGVRPRCMEQVGDGEPERSGTEATYWRHLFFRMEVYRAVTCLTSNATVRRPS